jgi:hypothetical protein
MINEFVDQEVRIRLLEKIAANIDHQFLMMNSKIDRKFRSQNRFLFGFLSMILIPVVLHYFDLT